MVDDSDSEVDAVVALVGSNKHHCSNTDSTADTSRTAVTAASTTAIEGVVSPVVRPSHNKLTLVISAVVLASPMLSLAMLMCRALLCMATL